MHIRIRSEYTSLSLPLPNALVFNRMTAHLCANAARRSGHASPVDEALLTQLFVQLHEAGTLLGDLPLVEVDSADGDHVEIFL